MGTESPLYSASVAYAEGHPKFHLLTQHPEKSLGELVQEGLKLLRSTMSMVNECIRTGEYYEKSSQAALNIQFLASTRFPLHPDAFLPLAKTVYFLVTESCMPLLYRIEMAASFPSLARLVKGTGLILPWRPLYQEMRKNHFLKARKSAPLLQFEYADALLRLANAARKFFPPEAGPEIMDTMRPLICAHDASLLKSQAFISILLPIKTYFPNSVLLELIHIWKTMDSFSSWDNMFFSIFARAAKSHLGKIDWSPHYEFLFTKILQNLTSHSLLIRQGDDFAGKEIMVFEDFLLKIGEQNLPKLLVYILSPNHVVFGHFRKLINHLAPYFHPSSYAEVSESFMDFLELISVHFVKRGLLEDKRQIPQEFKLNEHFSKEFFDLMHPLAMQALYSKNYLVANDVSSFLGNVVVLQPNSVIEKLISNINEDLQTLTESHRTYSLLMGLTSVAYLIANVHIYPKIAQLVCPLLEMTLPGIDPNDMKKTLLTIQLLKRIFCSVPFVACSKIECTKEELESYRQFISKNAPKLTLIDPLSPEGIEIHENFVQFGEFIKEYVVQFVEKIINLFVILEPTMNTEEHQHTEVTIVQELMRLMFSQMSSEIYLICVHKVSQYLDGISISVPPKKIGPFIETLIFANPKESLSKILPKYLTPLQNHTRSASLSEAEVIWNFKMLAWTIKLGGDEILIYKDQILRCVSFYVHDKSAKIKKAAAKFIRYGLRALCKTFVRDFRSLPQHIVDSKAFQYYPWMAWSIPLSASFIEADWRKPTESTRKVIHEILEAYLVPNIVLIEEFVSVRERRDEFDYGKENLRDALLLIKNILNGIKDIMPEWNSKEACSFHQEQSPRAVSLDNIAYYVSTLFVKALNYQRILFPDDSSLFLLSLKVLKLACQITTKKIRSLESSAKKTGKRGLKFNLFGEKKRPRLTHLSKLWTARNDIQNQKILRSESDDILVEVVKVIFDSTIQRTSKPRRYAHELLNAISRQHERIIEHFFQKLIDILNNPQSHEEETMSAIFSLSYEGNLRTIFTSWEYTITLMKCLVESSLFTNMSKNQQAIENFHQDFMNSFFTKASRFSVSFKIPEYLKDEFSDFDEATAKETQKKIETNFAHYYSQASILLDYLISTIENEKIPWRYRVTCISIVPALYREHKLPHSVLVPILKSITNEIHEIRNAGIQAAGILIEEFKVPHPRDYVLGTSFIHDPSYRFPLHITEEEWYKIDFQDKNYYGWYQQPFSFTRYKYSADQNASIEPNDPVLALLRDPSFYEQMFTRFESTHKDEEDDFTLDEGQLFKGLFQIYQDTFLDIIQPFILKLCQARDASFCQTLASDIIGGLVRGSKHWPYAKMMKMVDFLKPLLSDVVTNSNIDHRIVWTECFRFMVYDRDPRRLFWFINMALDFDLGSNTSNNEIKKLLLISSTIAEFSWRSLPICDILFEKVIKHVNHPSQQVRKEISALLVVIMKNHLVPHSHGPRTEPTKIDKYIEDSCAHLMETLDLPKTHPDYEDALRRKMTFLEFLSKAIRDNDCAAMLHHIKKVLYPLLSILSDENVDVRKICRTIAVDLMKPTFAVISMANHVIEAVERASQQPSWRIRLGSVALARLILLHEMFMMSDSQFIQLSELIFQRLCDEQVEVRNAASEAISDFIRTCSDEFIRGLVTRFTKLSKTPLQKRKASDMSGESSGNGGGSLQLSQRHGGVLGLIGIVLGFPYDIPVWMPEVLIAIAAHSKDPAAIKASVTRSISEFLKTHQNSWTQGDHFTEEQIQLLQQQIGSQSYYA